MASVMVNSVLLLLAILSSSLHSCHSKDYFDVCEERIAAVTKDNCITKPKSDLYISRDVPELPWYWSIQEDLHDQNRSLLVYTYNLALQRAFAISYIYQFQNKSIDFDKTPGFTYYYNIGDSALSASPKSVLSAGLYFDRDVFYDTWHNLPFNITVDLFGPRARTLQGQYNSGIFLTEDYAADFNLNYTHPGYKLNDWYLRWMPDVSGALDSVDKFTYATTHLTAKPSATQPEATTFNFFGPGIPLKTNTERGRRSYFTKPYFDCGKSNKWIVSASSPVVDYMPRYTAWIHLRKPKFVAASMVDVDFMKIDINPCVYSDKMRCKPSTECQPVFGMGFNRSAYECVCKTGYRYPAGQNGPFQGVVLDNATDTEYNNGFECIKVGNNDSASQTVDSTNMALVRQMAGVSPSNCASLRRPNLLLPLRSRRILKPFEIQGRLGLRLAHLLSSYLQTLQMNEDKPFNAQWIYGEIVGNVLADHRIVGSGVFYEAYQYGVDNAKYFGPYAWKKFEGSTPKVYTEDMAKAAAGYEQEWFFQNGRQPWIHSIPSLETYTRRWEERINVRYQYSKHHALYPMTFKASRFEDGSWLQPHFRCDGRLQEWVMTYTAPFFGTNKETNGIVFKGVVTVDISVTQDDIRKYA